MTSLTHGLASALYLFAAFLGWTGRSERIGPGGIRLVVALAVLVHAAGFYGFHLQEPPVPLSSFPAALSLIGWGVALAWLVSPRGLRLRASGPWVATIAAAFTIPGVLGLELAHQASENEDLSRWSHPHVLLAAAGFSLLALASLAGLGYLVKERGLKRRRAWQQGLPSLESLDHAEHVTLALGFALLTLGVLTGFAWTVSQHIDPWNKHVLSMLAAWGVYLVPVGARVVRQQRGPWPARGVVIGFLFLVCSYIGINLVGAGP
ncbi:MAG TPA: cytochrome c biogenesis protein CcsA [Myxococcota bacterium]|nr:cytochrome c biogenesis protein CcsA [Myxococcota bacterium]